MRDPFWKAMLAGLATVSVVPLVALAIASHDGGRDPARDFETHALPVTYDSSDLASLRSARRIARNRLRAAATSLRGCGGKCARWPLARLAVDGRVAGGILYGVAAGNLPADCRASAMGQANTLKLLGGQADQVVDGLSSSAPGARAETARAIRATRAMVGDLLRQLGRPACPGAASRER